MSGSRTSRVSWADEMDEVAPVDFVSSSADYLARLSGVTWEEPQDGWLAREIRAERERYPQDDSADEAERGGTPLPPYSGVSRPAASAQTAEASPDYNAVVYDDVPVDLDTFSGGGSLYDVLLQRVDSGLTGGAPGTRTHRGRTVMVGDGATLAPVRSWWDRRSYADLPVGEVLPAPLYCGVPYGVGVTGACWTDSHLKLQSQSDVNRYIEVLREGPAACGARMHTALGANDVRVSWSLAQMGDGSYATEFLLTEGGRQCSVYVRWAAASGQPVSESDGLVFSCGLAGLRSVNTSLAAVVKAICDAYALAAVEGDLSVPSVLQVADSSIKDMKARLARTQHASALKNDGGDRADLAHAMSTTPCALAEHATTRYSDFVYWSRKSGVSHGRLRASDVPPAQLVLLGANGGLSVSGYVLVVAATATRDISLIASSATSGCVLSQLADQPKHAPCIRDGLMSPMACAALHGDASGVLNITVDGSAIAVATIVTDAIDAPAAPEISTADMLGTQAALSDLGALCGYDTCVLRRQGKLGVRFSGHGRQFDVTMRYADDGEPRWMALLASRMRVVAAQVVPNKCESELALDWGASGLGRYLFATKTHQGVLRARRILVAKRGPFAHLTYEEGGKRCIITPGDEVTDYVLDTEYVTVRRGGETHTYTYAMGIAKFSHGRYVGSWGGLDLDDNLRSMLGSLEEADKARFKPAVDALRSQDLDRVDMADRLQMVREHLLTARNVRVYAKGREAEERMLHASRVGGTRLFRAQAGSVGSVVRELGSVLPKYESIAAQLGWTSSHNPAKEAVVFGRMAGLSWSLPHEQDVGCDQLATLLPAAGARVI